ncbi:MAG: 2-oxo acid dehydrogenase subunit E2, partial [Staphylococcus equorum]|nr:2-oxo acid dehydrogenase subunit E2 [Staphylococcus equorum]
MSNNIIMPKLGMTMTEGTVEEWHKQEGDTVESGEAILTISSEKLTQDIESPATGTLLEIKVQESENTEVKSVLGIIGESGESTDTETTNETTDNPNEDESSDSNDSQENNNSHITSKNPTEDEQNSETRIFISPLARNMANDNG